MRDPERTRRRLLEYATREFAEKGYAGARVDEIARKAGINKQALYYHFGSKEDVYRQALEDRFERFWERELSPDIDSKPPAQGLAELIAATFDGLSESQDLTAMLVDENRNKGRHLNRRRIREVNAPILASLKSLLARGAREGVFRGGVDPVQFYLSMMSLLIFSFSNVYTLSAVVGQDLKTDAAVRKRRAHIIDLLLSSLRPVGARRGA